MLEKIIAGCLIGATLSLVSCSPKEEHKETYIGSQTKDLNKDISNKLTKLEDFSTPEKAIINYIEAYKRKDYSRLLRYYGFSNEENKEIRKYINPEEEKKYDEYLIKNNLMSSKEIEESNRRRIKYSLDIVDILKNEPKENINKYSINIVDIKYCIIRKEEAAFVRTILTDEQTGEKEEIYYRLANKSGKWLVVGQFKPPIPKFNIYDTSTIRNNNHKSRIIEELKKRLLKRLDNKKDIQKMMK